MSKCIQEGISAQSEQIGKILQSEMHHGDPKSCLRNRRLNFGKRPLAGPHSILLEPFRMLLFVIVRRLSGAMQEIFLDSS